MKIEQKHQQLQLQEKDNFLDSAVWEEVNFLDSVVKEKDNFLDSAVREEVNFLDSAVRLRRKLFNKHDDDRKKKNQGSRASKN